MKLTKGITYKYGDYELEIKKYFAVPGDCLSIHFGRLTAQFSYKIIRIGNTNYPMRDITCKISKVTIVDNGWEFENTINFPKGVVEQLIEILEFCVETYSQIQDYLIGDSELYSVRYFEEFLLNDLVTGPICLLNNGRNHLYYKNYKITTDADYYGDYIQFITADGIIVSFTRMLMKFKGKFFHMTDITNKIPGAKVSKEKLEFENSIELANIIDNFPGAIITKEEWEFENTIDLANVADQLVEIVDYCVKSDLLITEFVANVFASNTKSAKSAQ